VDEIYAMFPNLEGARQQPRHAPVGRRAADAGRGAHPAHRRRAAAARRDFRRPGAGHRAEAGRDDPTLKAKGYTIVLVEQNFRFAAPLADRFYVMEHGRIVEKFGASQLAANMPCCRNTSASSPPTVQSPRSPLCSRLPAAVRAPGRCAPDAQSPGEPPTPTTSNNLQETTMIKRLGTLSIGILAIGIGAAHAQEKVKIGFVTDLSSLYADLEGKGGATAIQMAIDDFGGKALGQPIELLVADHQNKADIAASKAREWVDTAGVTMIFGGTNSGTALATAKVAEEKKRVYFNNGAGTSALTNEQCSPYTVHYAFDTVALAKGTGAAVVEGGGKSWFFLTADYAFGHALRPTRPRS
jgi:hypothetical protein